MDYLVHHLLRKSAHRHPDKTAVIHGDIALSYSELWRSVNDLATLFRRPDSECGVRRRDRVAIWLPPSINLVESIFAVPAAGGVFVPIHHSLMASQIKHILADSAVHTLTTSTTLLKMLDVDALSPSVKQIVIVDDGPIPEAFAGDERVLKRENYTAASDVGNVDSECLELDLAAILYTSGSTGLPKGVMLSHRNLLAGTSIVSEYLKITSDDRILAALPFNFDAGLNQLMTSVEQGSTLVLIQFLFGREIVAAIHKESITGLAGVPPLWNLLTQENSTLSRRGAPSLRYISNTGGAMPKTLLDQLKSSLPETDIYLMYGLTEAFRSTYLPPDQIDQRPGSMGKAIPNTEIMVVGEDGSLCGPRETGELVHHGPTVTLGYWGQPEATAKVFRPHPDPQPGDGAVDRVVYSGDLVYADEEGFLYFVGRRDTMIKTSGFRVSPVEVEAGLMQTGLVTQAAVVGIPDPVLGQKIHAFVSTDAASPGFELNEILVSSSEHLPRFMIPKSISALREFPKTASGKIDYPSLREQATNLADEGQSSRSDSNMNQASQRSGEQAL